MFPTLRPGHPALLHAIHAAVPSLPLDPVVLQALLTCIVAQDAHLIIRTNDEDVSAVARLVVWVRCCSLCLPISDTFAQILSSLFAYPTHKIKIRPKSASPSHHYYFLRSLFLPPSPSLSGSQDESSDPNRPRRLPSRPSRTSRASPISPVHMDSTSLSNVSSKSPIGHRVRSPSHSETGFHHHSHVSHHPHPGNPSPPQLPRAIVISGLENTTASSQRALAQVLAEKRVFFDNPRDARSPQSTRHDAEGDESTGPWPLPDGFIAVYVCPIDPRERPNIHNTLVSPIYTSRMMKF